MLLNVLVLKDVKTKLTSRRSLRRFIKSSQLCGNFEGWLVKLLLLVHVFEQTLLKSTPKAQHKSSYHIFRCSTFSNSWRRMPVKSDPRWQWNETELFEKRRQIFVEESWNHINIENSLPRNELNWTYRSPTRKGLFVVIIDLKLAWSQVLINEMTTNAFCGHENRKKDHYQIYTTKIDFKTACTEVIKQ